MAKTDAWMPLYIGDYLSNTTRLTTEQHGAYLLLIMDYWSNGRLPDDDTVLAAVTKLPVERWQAIRPAITGFFEAIDGFLIHERIEAEKEKAERIYRVRSEAGSKRAAKSEQTGQQNANKTETKPQQKGTQSQPQSHASNEADIYTLPDWIDPDLWREWMDVRKRKKAINTARAKNALIAKLVIIRDAGIDPNKAISTAIERSWQGIELEWLMKPGGNNGNTNGKTPLERAAESIQRHRPV